MSNNIFSFSAKNNILGRKSKNGKNTRNNRKSY